MREAVIRQHGSSHSVASDGEKRGPLILIFLTTFLLPILIGLYIGGFFGRFTVRDSVVVDKMFPQASIFARQGSFLRIPHHPELNPSGKKDWVLFTAINLKRLPQAGERLLVLSKFDGNSRSKNGFALGFSGTEHAVRPVVLWNDSTGVERWYDFPEVDLSGRGFELFALSVQEGRYLGLHSLALGKNEEHEVRVLGGYDLQQVVTPTSESPLIVGAALERNVRGALGMLGIVEGKSIISTLDSVMSSLASDPLTVPESISAKSIRLWFHSGSDHSAQKIAVEKVDPHNARG